MKQLLLLRHAKSSHKDSTLTDFERPLSGRGRKNCKTMGKWLSDEKLTPDLVLSSTAERAKQTSLRIVKKMGLQADIIQWEPAIYDANARTLLKLLSEVPADIDTVMLVGHHEGLDSIILRLSKWADIPAEPKLLPTGAVARLEIDDNWANIKKCQGRLISITRPRELDTKSAANRSGKAVAR